MPEDLLLTYCRRICAILRKRINGKIYVNPDENDIVVDICWRDFQHQCRISNMHSLVRDGVSSELLANYVYKSYRESLLKEAFL